MTEYDILKEAYDNMLKGILPDKVSYNQISMIMSREALRLLNNQQWSESDKVLTDLILHISNLLYNNSSITVLPLDDGLYDQLLVAYKKYNPLTYQVGSIPVNLQEHSNIEYSNDIRQIYHTVKDEELDKNIFARDIQQQHTSLLTPTRKRTIYHLNREPITKRLINSEHTYPELVGTLDKCKFVLNEQARIANVFDNPTVQIFERDFIHQCITQGIIHQDEIFEMVGELKYDGVSVEAEIQNGCIVKALSRGDTGANIAADLTPILGGYKFPCAQYANIDPNYKFGIKFEAVITKRDLERLNTLRGKDYKNCRNAIIGLLGSGDAYRYVDYITLIPIATSENTPRIAELEFLNRFFHSGELNRFCVFKGNYIQILFQVKQFTEAAEMLRPILPYMIDGIVVSFTDPMKIKLLGRVNSVNKWQMAIKFNPKKVRTIFDHYTYSIGKSGQVIPMVHFKPVEFIGTIHSKQTVHSFQRFKELALIKGQEIDIEYVNDVLTYITKPDTEYNRQLQQTMQPEEFITSCPYCGSPIYVSDTMKSAFCPNIHCHERSIMRMIDTISQLGFKDISEDVVRRLDLINFRDLFKMYDKESLVNLLGPLTADKYLYYINEFINKPINDYDLLSAMCFEDMAKEKWKRVLSHYELSLLFKFNPQQLQDALLSIKGIGMATINSIIYGFSNYNLDIQMCLDRLHIVDTKTNLFATRPKVVLTGIRSPELIQNINNLGFDCQESYGLTKDTTLLICDSYNSNSGKVQKAKKYGIPILSVDDFYKKYKL